MLSDEETDSEAKNDSEAKMAMTGNTTTKVQIKNRNRIMDDGIRTKMKQQRKLRDGKRI